MKLQVFRIMIMPQNFIPEEPCKNDTYFGLVISNNQADLMAALLFADEGPCELTCEQTMLTLCQ